MRNTDDIALRALEAKLDELELHIDKVLQHKNLPSNARASMSETPSVGVLESDKLFARWWSRVKTFAST